MNTPRIRSVFDFMRPCPRGLAWLALLFVLPGLTGLRAETAGGIISGSVSNAGTGDLLEGVRVALPALGLNGLTDNTGRYTLPGVPPGTHEITATYT
ncbi:MAG: carboxypeptidase regulatory-like domain-containing protein, partial [Verrucomicrobiota bacterium]